MRKEPEPRARRRAGKRVIDRNRAAGLLTQGMTVAAVAEHIGWSRNTLSDRQRRDPDFETSLADDRETQVSEEGRELAEMRQPLEQAVVNQVRGGNLRVLLWLADRLKLGTPPNELTSDQELREMLAGLTSEELSEFAALRDEP
jgi:transposase-like protein